MLKNTLEYKTTYKNKDVHMGNNIQRITSAIETGIHSTIQSNTSIIQKITETIKASGEVVENHINISTCSKADYTLLMVAVSESDMPGVERQLKKLRPDILMVQELHPKISATIVKALPNHKKAATNVKDEPGWDNEVGLKYDHSIGQMGAYYIMNLFFFSAIPEIRLGIHEHLNRNRG